MIIKLELHGRCGKYMFVKVHKNIKLVKFIYCILIIFVLVSCRQTTCSQSKSMNINQMYKEKEFMNVAGREIIRCIKERDKESLSDLFCEKVRNTDYLNKEIDFFFKYIDEYDIQIDEGGKWVSNGGHSGSNGWDIVVDYKGARYDKNVTIGLKKYDFAYGYYKTLTKHKEYEGITYIIFCDERNLLSAPLEKINIAKNDRSPGDYLGIGIYNTNYDTYLRENVVPKEIYENDEYRFDDDELEKNHDNW